MSDTVETLSERLNTYAMQLPRQARWHSEILASELAAEMAAALARLRRREPSARAAMGTSGVHCVHGVHARRRGAVRRAVSHCRDQVFRP